MDHIRNFALEIDFPPSGIHHIELAVEELLVNIINYAYPEEDGDIEIHCKVLEDGAICILIIDEGIPFDVSGKEDPDVSIPVEERKIGGLGILLAKEMMDSLEYSRENNKNILRIVKNK